MQKSRVRMNESIKIRFYLLIYKFIIQKKKKTTIEINKKSRI